MKIGIDARLTHYRTGGISTYIRRVVAALEQMNDGDDRYRVFVSRKARTPITTRFPESRLWTPPHNRVERLALSAELVRHRLDLFHSPDFIPPLRGARRHIITVHDLNFFYYPQFLTRESLRYYNGQIATAICQADHILADSQATKDDLVAMLNVAPDQVTVHMLGVDESFCPQPADAVAHMRAALDLPPAYYLFLGTFEPRKNIRGLLDAYRLLSDRLPDAPPLVLAGQRGWMFDETMAHISSLGLGERVLWRENVAQALLPALYTAACAVVTPSHYEGFGLPALEGMACGTVPIVSHRGSLPEVVGAVGAQVDPDDADALAGAMARVLTDVAWRAEQEAAGLRRAATFTWAATAHIVRAAYHAVLT